MEDNLLDVRIGCEDLSCLKGCQRLSCTGSMPDIGVAICERSLPYKGFYGIHLIGAHNHQNLIRIVQDGIACQHLDDVIPCQKRDLEVLQVGNTDVVEIRPEEGEAIHQVPVGVGKVFGINAVGDNEKLNEVI